MSHKTFLLLTLILTGGILLPKAMWGYVEPTASAAGMTFTVTNTNNSGAGSLRQAILDANANAGLDTINFSIGTGPQTIKPTQMFPALTDPVIIDGTTQPGFSGSPIIEIDCSALAEGHGLSLTGGDSTVRGLVINGANFDGIAFGFKGGNRVEGCYIGTDITGMVARPNGGNGIRIPGSNNVIGGTTLAARNIISGNNGVGVDISRFCCTGDQTPITGNVVQGNYIGVNRTGSAAIPNRHQGVRISSDNANVPMTDNLIGGTQAGAGNVVSGNHEEGILLDGFHVRNNTVQGNFVGTDATGSFAIPNDSIGVAVTGSDNLIGGTQAGARNVISGNGCSGTGCTTTGHGLTLGARSGNIAKGNIIGVNAALTAPLPNTGYGVVVGGTNSVVGGTGAGEGNVIAFNAYNGIGDGNSASSGNTFRGNSIFSNGYLNHPSNASLGIDLGTAGVTPNDTGDADTGTNNLQNFPVITSVTAGAGNVNVKGTLNSTASTTFNLDFYANSVCDPLGYGEGARFIGSGAVTTDAGGNASFDLNFSVTLPAGQILTATATDPSGNTSEFSQCSSTTQSSGSLGFSSSFMTVSEGVGTASFTVNRTGGSSGSLTATYKIYGRTATEGSDFTATSGTLTFADGETSKTFTVPIIDDNFDEAFAETAIVVLSTSDYLDRLGSQSTVTLTINDNDPLPTLSMSSVSAAEGNSGTTAFTFVVKLTGVTSRVVTANYTTEDDTAVAGSDYIAASGVLTFNPGETEKTVTVLVNGDTAYELNESFFIFLFNVQNGTLVNDQGLGTGTIVNDDTSAVQFNSGNYSVNEGDASGQVTITVSRTGDSSIPLTVDYATSDASGMTPCQTNGNGIASDRCDYATAIGTLRFAVGETSRTIQIPIINDAYQEPNEVFSITFSNPHGASLGLSTATVTIVDNDTQTATTNPIDDQAFFIKQQYVDFLGRVAEPDGFTFWMNRMNGNCPVGQTCDRIDTSQRFFQSDEFQERGFYVYRLYDVILGRLPKYAEFVPDVARLNGYQTVAEQRASKDAYLLDFVKKPEFAALYGQYLSGDYLAAVDAAGFVEALCRKSGITPADKQNLIFRLQVGSSNTAQTLENFILSPEISTVGSRYYDRGFITMQYFGYLRRDPEQAGFDFWVGQLIGANAPHKGDYRFMVKGFLQSDEYRFRFALISAAP